MAHDKHDVPVDEICDVERTERRLPRAVGRSVTDAPRRPSTRHATGYLEPRIEATLPGRDPLPEALDRMVGHRNGRSSVYWRFAVTHVANKRCSSPTTGELSNEDTRRIASSIPGMNERRSIES